MVGEPRVRQVREEDHGSMRRCFTEHVGKVKAIRAGSEFDIENDAVGIETQDAASGIGDTRSRVDDEIACFEGSCEQLAEQRVVFDDEQRTPKHCASRLIAEVRSQGFSTLNATIGRMPGYPCLC